MNHKVLIVDDDHHLLEGLHRNLRKEPYEIILAGSGDQALTLLASAPVDVVVSDQDMAGMSGIDLLKQIKMKYPETARFMLTGKATLELAIQAINEGEITRFFQKPCHHVELSIAIRQAIVHKCLLSKVRELLHQNHTQQQMILGLEKTYPGISKIKRDLEGSVVLDDVPQGYAEFLAQLDQEFGSQSSLDKSE